MYHQKSTYKHQQRSRSRSKNRQHSRSRSRSRNRRQNDQSNKIPQHFQNQPTKSLYINKLIEQSVVQNIFDSLSIQVQTSLPDDIQHLNNITVIKYPSVQSALKIMEKICGRIKIQDVVYVVDYYPKKDNVMIIQDWHCDKCNFTNFSRRNKCHRCQNIRNSLCKPVFNSTSILRLQNTTNRDEINPCSIMLRGNIISLIQQNTLIDIFQYYGPLKDVRMIRNRATGGYKDFAFVEYFTPQQASMAYKAATDPSFRIQNQSISCLYSKNRKQQGLGPQQYSSSGRGPKQISTQNYFQKQRQRQIKYEQEKQIITMDMLKQRKQEQLRKQQMNTIPKQLSKQKMNRRLAQQSMKQWEKKTKVQTSIIQIMYICPLCCKKFKDQVQLKNHQDKSALHKRMYDRLII